MKPLWEMKKRHNKTRGATTGHARTVQRREERPSLALDWLMKMIESLTLCNGFVLDLPLAIFIDQCNRSRPCLTIAQREGERSRGG